MTLYNLRRTGPGYTMVKWDNLLNIEAIYELSPLDGGRLACNCPAGPRPTCKHRKMVPLFIAHHAVDTQRFYDYEHQFWQEPIPTFGEGDPIAEKAALMTAEEIEGLQDGVEKDNQHAMQELVPVKHEGIRRV